MRLLCYKLLLLTLCFTASTSMMMRNNALISRMISKFQKDSVPVQSKPTALQNPKDVLTLMQNVLCKNFPTIPCQMIIEDETLRTLIERSIQQLKYKKLTMQNTTPPPAYHLTLFPTINSEDLSNFLQVSDTGYYSQSKQEKTRSRRHKKRLEKELKKNGNKKKNNQRSSPYQGHKNIRKFYPHKIKYKDKSENNPKENNNFRDYSDEKFSMSVENLLANERNGMKRFDSNFRQAPENLPVWRIDYTKHGEPSVNMFDYESDRLKEKLVKTGPNVIVNEGTLEQAPRKDVMHPDVYIKRNYIRRNALDVDSAEATTLSLTQRPRRTHTAHILIIRIHNNRTAQSPDVVRQPRSEHVDMSKPVLSTHVLDTSTGSPAAGVFVELYKKSGPSWTLWHSTATTGDGRALFPFTNDSMAAGTYKLTFKVEDYYKTLNKETLYPYVEITFTTKDGQHYHIPLLLSPYGYTTYRGS